jgi:Mrp family chromosome partitioning ATPase
VEKKLGVPVLAMVPQSPRTGSADKGATIRPSGSFPSIPVAAADVSSRFSEAIRAIRNTVLLSPGARSLLIASSNAGEGSVSIATNLAAVLVQSGSRVLLVDADRLTPELHLELNIVNGTGLGEFLAGQSSELKITQPVPSLLDLYVVTAGKTGSADAITSPAFHTLLLDWRQRFDYVLLTCSPLLVANSGMLLANRVDSTLLVARHSTSRLTQLMSVRDTLLRCDARLQGIVIHDYPEQPARWDESEKSEESLNAYPDLSRQSRIAG